MKESAPLMRWDPITRSLHAGEPTEPAIAQKLRAPRERRAKASIMQQSAYTQSEVIDMQLEGHAIHCQRCDRDEAYGADWPGVGRVCTACHRALMLQATPDEDE